MSGIKRQAADDFKAERDALRDVVRIEEPGWLGLLIPLAGLAEYSKARAAAHEDYLAGLSRRSDLRSAVERVTRRTRDGR